MSDLLIGIDLSKYQDPATIDYDKIAEQVDFVILRIGFGWLKDIYFERHYLPLLSGASASAVTTSR